MDIRCGDMVVLRKTVTGAMGPDGRPAGKEKRGEQVKVLRVYPEAGRLLLEGVRFLWKHQKPNKTAPKGARIQKESPISVSIVQLICPSCGKPTRVGHKRAEVSGRKQNVRVCRECQAVIETRKG